MRRAWNEIAKWHYIRALERDATVGRLHHHLHIVSRGNYTRSFFHITKALTASKPFARAWETMVSSLLKQFVVSEGQTSTRLDEVLSMDEDNLYTAISRLLLASAPSKDLKKNGFDTCPEAHLRAFDKLLRFVAGLDGLKPSKLIALFQMSMGPQTADDAIDLAPSLVGPASHYGESTCYIRGKTTIGAALHATREEYTKKVNATPSYLDSEGLIGWAIKKLFHFSSWPVESVQSYTVRPR